MNKYVGKTDIFYFRVYETRGIFNLSLDQGLTSSQNGIKKSQQLSQEKHLGNTGMS